MALVHLIAQADALSKLTLLTLTSMSIVCWGITLYKLVLLRVKKNQLRKTYSALSSITSLDGLLKLGASVQDSAGGHVIAHALTMLKSLLTTQYGTKNILSEHDMRLMQASLEHVLDDIHSQEEEYIPVLKVSAEVAPLIGLFGTVWGLIHSFIRISHQQSADIVTVAPGISEALITTLMGLIVAIPALVMFNYLRLKIQELDRQLFALAERIEWLIIRNLGREEGG